MYTYCILETIFLIKNVLILLNVHLSFENIDYVFNLLIYTYLSKLKNILKFRITD